MGFRALWKAMGFEGIRGIYWTGGQGRSVRLKNSAPSMICWFAAVVAIGQVRKVEERLL
jgi:hypothetical protein